MRTLSIILSALLLLVSASCSKPEVQEDILFSEKTFSTSTIQAVTFHGSFTAYTDWTISTNDKWITILSDAEGTAGKYKLEFRVGSMPFRGDLYREGIIYFISPNKTYTIKVLQGNKPGAGTGSNPNVNM